MGEGESNVVEDYLTEVNDEEGSMEGVGGGKLVERDRWRRIG